jgi:hypothetical protein
MRGKAGDDPPAEHHVPSRGLHPTGDDVEERGLARAVRARDADDLAGLDRQGYPFERGEPAESLPDIATFEARNLDR